MGKINTGILGPIRGKVGTVIGSSWKGIPYIRSVSGKPRRPATPAQLAQQAKFNIVVRFTAPMAHLFRSTFAGYADKMAGINSAQSYIMKNALTGEFPDYVIDYNLVLVSRGDLPAAQAAAATATGDYLHFNWQWNAVPGRAKATDRAIMVAYCPVLKSAAFTLEGPERRTGAGTLNVGMFKGNSVHTWLGFLACDRNSTASNSSYTGAFALA